MDRETKNKDNKELFWKIWSDTRQEAEFGFNPIKTSLEEKAYNQNALEKYLEKYFGEDLLKA